VIATSYPVLESCARWFPTSCQQKCGSRRTSAKGLERKLVAELWLYPDNSMLLELSTKCAPSETFQVGVETRTFLTQHGVDLSGEQETKTKKALEFFSKRLQAKA
jgi:hypothetical protein